MATDRFTFQRARKPEHKQQRQGAILAAARALGRRDGVRNVSLADIACEVGVHKSALLRYFGTRDEIYLRLATEDWREWADALGTELDAAPAGSIAAVADRFTRTLADRPLFCDLLTHTALNLERNVSVDAVRTYKLTTLAAVAEIGGHVGRLLPELAEPDTADLIAAVTAIAARLWQVARPPAALAALYRDDPELCRAQPEFSPSLRRIATVILTGLRQLATTPEP